MSQTPSTSKKSWVLFALFLVLGLVLGMKLNSYFVSKELRKSIAGGKIESVLRVINDNYVDTVNINNLSDEVLTQMLMYLDPHSMYVPAKDFLEAEEEIEGNFEGIGVQFRMIEDTVVIIMPVSGGPSEKAGVKSGDRIVKVDTTIIAGKGLSTEDIMKKLKGQKGSKVKLGIARSKVKGLVNITVARDIIPTFSIDVSFMADKEIGYIKVSKFTKTTAEEFAKAMSSLEGQGMKKLIVDMRSNGGGLLGSCVDISDMFLDKGDMIVYTKGEHRAKSEIMASGRGKYKKAPFPFSGNISLDSVKKYRLKRTFCLYLVSAL